MPYKNLSVLAVLIATVLAITSLWDDAFIVDEIPHVGAGYSYVTKGDFRLNPEHPPLAKDMAGLALFLLPINQSVFSSEYWTSDINGQWNFGRALIFNRNNNVDTVTRTAKTTMLLFFILAAVMIYKWTKDRYGNKAAFLGILLFAFSPTVLAHSRFVTTDTPALFGVLFGTYFFIKFIQKPTNKNFWTASAAFGVAQLTKFSAVILAPFFILVVIAWCFANSSSLKTCAISFVRTLLLMAAGIIIVVWPVYALHTMNYPPERQHRDTSYYLDSYGNRLIADPVVWASDKPVLRSLAHYATGILMVNQRSIGGNTTFFMGEVRNYAWKQYFPVVYAIKEPLPFWGLVVIVLLALSLKFKKFSPTFKKVREWAREYFVELSMLLWIAAYWYLSIRANLNIGVRHLLPTYGFVFILLSGQLSKLRWDKIKFVPVLVVSLFGWYIYENVSVYPYYLTYFNQLAGGPKGGYQYVVDSNLDWGQDLKRLTEWIEDNNINKIHFDYFGWADQTYYLKNKLTWIQGGRYKSAHDFLKENPSGGYIAVSASFYMGSREKQETSYAWLDSYKPIAVIGNSIFVWEIRP